MVTTTHLPHYPLDDQFDLAFADSLAQLEANHKHLYRPNYLHKWWARRCGTTFRALLKHLTTDERASDFYSPGGLEGQIILDPMMGGGTTLHEAIRLGANVIGADIDPIPILQARATLSALSLIQLEASWQPFFDQLATQIAPFFQTHCPFCQQSAEEKFTLHGSIHQSGQERLIRIDDFILRHNSDKTKWHLRPNGDLFLEDRWVANTPLPYPVLGQGKQKNRDQWQEVTELPFYQRYIPLVTAGKCPTHGFFFTGIDAEKQDQLARAEALRPQLRFVSADFLIPNGSKSNHLHQHHIDNYLDLFSSRQLLYLHHAIDALTSLEPLPRLNFALLLSASTEFNSLLCGYKGANSYRAGSVRHVFAYHAYAIPHTALENNPTCHDYGSGTLLNLYNRRLVRGKVWSQNPIERRPSADGAPPSKHPVAEADWGDEAADFAELSAKRSQQFLLYQRSSIQLPLPDQVVDHIFTDPPYYDSVQYSDLATFFRVWLRQLLPDSAEWQYDTQNAAVDHEHNSPEHYRQTLGAIFAEANRVMKQSGRLILTFHHWRWQSWADLTCALHHGGFGLLNAYPIHAEHTRSVHIANRHALVHDLILVCAKRGSADFPLWHPPATLSRTDSGQFCQQCGQVLGYLLSQADLSSAEIHAFWQRRG